MRVALALAMSVVSPGRHTFSRCGMMWGPSISVMVSTVISGCFSILSPARLLGRVTSSSFRILAAASPGISDGWDVCVNSVVKVLFWYWILLTGGPPGGVCGFSFSMGLTSGFLGF